MPSSQFYQASLSEIRDALVDAGITGPHRSHPRRGTLWKIYSMLDRDDEATFGISTARNYTASEIIGFMSEITGCSDDLVDVDAQDLIDPDVTMRALLAAAVRLRDEAARGSTLLAATGHPTGMLEHYMHIVAAYQEAGGKLVQLGEDQRFTYRKREKEICYVGGVAVMSDGASLEHVHSSAPMEVLLESGAPPDMVMGDHGYAGAAIERGIPTITVMDINDQALSVAWAEKRDVIVVPLDDNRPQRLYEPAWTLFERIISGDRSLLVAQAEAAGGD